MKRIIVILATLSLVTVAYSQVEDKAPTWTETSSAFVLTGMVSYIDSLTSGNTTSFDPTTILAYLQRGNINAYTTRDSSAKYLRSNDVLFFTRVSALDSNYNNGSATGDSLSDSLSSVRIQCSDYSNNWYSADTLSTAKQTPCAKTVTYNGLTRPAKAWRISFKSASLGRKANYVRLEYWVIIPKKF